jgi:hypothetical protein
MVRSTKTQMKSVERDALVFMRKEGSDTGAQSSPVVKQRQTRAENSVYTILNELAFELREVARWEAEKTKRISAVNRKWVEMDVAPLREILESNLPWVTEDTVAPRQVLA